MGTTFVESYRIFVNDVWMATLPIDTSDSILRSIMATADDSIIKIVKTKTKVDADEKDI